MKTVMTVDDSVSMRQMVSLVLRGGGYEVVEAVDGLDALSKLNGQELHLFPDRCEYAGHGRSGIHAAGTRASRL